MRSRRYRRRGYDERDKGGGRQRRRKAKREREKEGRERWRSRRAGEASEERSERFAISRIESNLVARGAISPERFLRRRFTTDYRWFAIYGNEPFEPRFRGRACVACVHRATDPARRNLSRVCAGARGSRSRISDRAEDHDA